MAYWSVTVYSLCFVASACCTWILLRAWRRNSERVFAWIGACFGAFAINNLLAVLRYLVLPDADLFVCRSLLTLVGLSFLLYGFIWEGE